MNAFLLDVERGIRQGLLELLEESENEKNRLVRQHQSGLSSSIRCVNTEENFTPSFHKGSVVHV